jgi:RNA polymerase sigma-70 factor (ECF subfamily)
MNDAMNTLSSKQEYERLLKPLMRLAFGVALHLTRNRDDAEDLVQEAAIQAYRAFHTFQPGSHFKAWFLRIMTNLFLNKVRKKQREPEIASLDDAPDLYLYNQVTLHGWTKGNEDPAKQILERIGAEQMVAAIAALPEEFRIVAALYFVEELPYQEIADILDCPLGTVRSRLHRGRKLLQRALWELIQETPCARTPPQTKGGN